MTCVRPVCSSAAAVLNRIPFLAPTPFPTIMATGVASPSAHGQLITSTEIALARENDMSFETAIQMRKVTAAIAITTGTKTALTRSAALATGAFVAAASETI